MALGETLIACKNGEILVMRTWLGATAGVFDARTVGGGFETVAVVSQICLASARFGNLWTTKAISAGTQLFKMPERWGWELASRMKELQSFHLAACVPEVLRHNLYRWSVAYKGWTMRFLTPLVQNNDIQASKCLLCLPNALGSHSLT
jgi:hypothetical protein